MTTPTYVQSGSNEDVSSGITLAVTLTGVVAGNTLHVWCVTDGSSSADPPACSSNVDGSFGSPLDDVHDTLHDNFVAHFSKIGVNGGSTTVTITWPTATFFRGICVMEIANATTLIDHKANIQDTPGTSTDGVTSTSMTLVGTCLLVAVSYHTTTANNPPNAGTGFTSRGTMWPSLSGARIESGAFGAGSQAATATAVINQTHVTLGAAYANDQIDVRTYSIVQTTHISS